MKKFYYQVVSIENVKILKYHTFWEKKKFICSKCKNEDKKYLKKNQLRYYNFLV